MRRRFVRCDDVRHAEAEVGARPRPPAASAIVAVFEHVVAGRVQRPVGAFARPAFLSGHLDETVVETQVVADGILPALLVVPVVGELVHDELVDAVERDLLVGRVLDGHGDERDVRIGRLLAGRNPPHDLRFGRR